VKLVLDLGNTLSKAAVFSGNKMLFSRNYEKLSADDLNSILSNFPQVKKSLLCSVIDHPEELQKILEDKTRFTLLNEKTPLPIKNLYLQPKTLGKDRLANAVGGNSIYPGENVLVLDAGTCIKYDLVNSDNEYLGGAIAPGLNMRYKALNDYTAKLPLLKLSENEVLIGRTTDESLTSGVQNGAVSEADGMIKSFLAKYPDLKIVLTGGDMLFFKERLSEKNSIFADPFLLMKGLNTILDHNNRQ
jgi:type III pantothenate kinase